MVERTIKCGKYSLEFGKKTLVMGIVNVTPDSFSDGGQFLDSEKAIAQGLFPDVISTDISTNSMYLKQVFSLPMVMTRFLALGMPLVEVIRACTETPARLMGMAGQIGTLQPGALADICIMKNQTRPVELVDMYDNTIKGDRVLIPQMTIKAGRIKYCHMDFVLR